MRLSQRDLVASDPGSPFGGGTSPMSGGGGGTGAGGSGSPAEASPSHQGPPPAAAGAAHMVRCNDCGYMAKDGGDLEEHMRKEHFVRQTMSSKQPTDISTPAALIFIDALGDTIPFKSSFTFKELSDFCRREGVSMLSPTPLTDGDLIKIAETVATLTQDHVQIETQPTQGDAREPFSAVDLSVAARAAGKECRNCQTKIASYRIFCDTCNAAREQGKQVQAIRLYAHVTLKDGASLHVVEIGKETLVGVDDFFVPRDFTASDAITIHNLDDDLRTVEASACDMCGEEGYDFSSKCANCGAARSAS